MLKAKAPPPPLPGTCPRCHGAGTIEAQGARVSCPRCHGAPGLSVHRLPPTPGALLKGSRPDVPR